MIDPSKRSQQMTLWGTRDATSLQVSDCGTTRLISLDGTNIHPFGRGVVPVNRLAPQDNKKLSKMIATYSPSGIASSQSVSLQSSLESKLAAQLPTGGLTMFIKGWKRKATPSGRLYCQLVPSVRPIDVSDYGLWPTPTAVNPSDGTPYHKQLEQLKERRKRAKEQGLNGSGRSMSLSMAAQMQPYMALWATPTANDHKGSGPTVIRKDGKNRTWDRLDYATEQGMTLWATPNTMDGMKARSLESLNRAKTKGGCANLKDQIHPALWATPSANDAKKGANCNPNKVRHSVTRQAITFGKQANGSSAQTESKGSLNPAFPCWLMGIPSAWLSSMRQAMQSYRK